jgi:hypothetical protein
MKPKQKKNIMNIKSRTPKQIAGAGMTLAGGMIALPFIKFKNARHYRFGKKKGGK